MKPDYRSFGRAVLVLASAACADSSAEELVVQLGNADSVHWVGAVQRWDMDGNPRRMVNSKSRMDSPDVDAVAERSETGQWTFADLPRGRYDLVILARDRVRIEGFGYPPVLEFDPFLSHTDRAPTAACEFIEHDVAQLRLYENKVAPLHFAGDPRSVRVLVQLLRDQPTSYDREFGEPVATLRHEVWQYTNRYGVWSKEKRTRVLDRVLAARRELRQWTWVWEPALGQIAVADEPVRVQFTLPSRFEPTVQRGLFPH